MILALLLIACGFEVNVFGSGEFGAYGFGAFWWEGISYEIGCLFQSIDPNNLVFRLSSSLLLPYFLKNLHAFSLDKKRRKPYLEQ